MNQFYQSIYFLKENDGDSCYSDDLNSLEPIVPMMKKDKKSFRNLKKKLFVSTDWCVKYLEDEGQKIQINQLVFRRKSCGCTECGLQNNFQMRKQYIRNNTTQPRSNMRTLLRSLTRIVDCKISIQRKFKQMVAQNNKRKQQNELSSGKVDQGSPNSQNSLKKIPQENISKKTFVIQLSKEKVKIFTKTDDTIFKSPRNLYYASKQKIRKESKDQILQNQTKLVTRSRDREVQAVYLNKNYPRPKDRPQLDLPNQEYFKIAKLPQVINKTQKNAI